MVGLHLIVFTTDSSENDESAIIFDVFKYLSLALGGVLIIFVVCNTVQYLIKKEKYKVFSILCQYLAVYVAIIAMMGYTILIPSDECNITQESLLHVGITASTIFGYCQTCIFTIIYFQLRSLFEFSSSLICAVGGHKD